MLPTARPLRSLALLLALSATPHALAADCDGGTVLRLRAGATNVRYEGTITRRGATPATLVGAGGFQLSLVQPDDGSVAYTVTIPAGHFTVGSKDTRYDHGADFKGDILLRAVRGQADTVRIILRDPGTGVGPLAGSALRAVVTTDAACGRTCTSSCRVKSGRLQCARSEPYVPFADSGFGKPARGNRRVKNPLCGLAIDTTSPCDFLVDERCLLPFPSSYFLAADASTPTGLRLNYGPQALPKNIANKYIDPTDWNTLDGFSPGPPILALFPDTGFPVDLTASDAAFHTDFARSLEADHPTVLLDAASGTRVLHFVEMDANTDDVSKKALIIRPGRRLDDGTRYLVAIRNLVDTHGTPITPRLAFRALRDAVAAKRIERACGQSCAAAIAARAPVFNDIFTRLEAQGVARADLLLAWDFTTASSAALTDWIVAVRDQAFALGTPAFSVTSVDDGGGAGRNAQIWAEIQGTFQAPLFMTADAPASRLNLVGGVPTQNGFATVPFVVEIPRIVYNGSGTAVPGRPTLWGHGLLGDRFQARGLSEFANQFGFVVGGVDMQGMSNADVAPAIVPLISDLSLFHYIPERLHQGFLNHLLLGRLMLDPVHGFAADPQFQFGGGPAIDTSEVFYSGGSQGGIFGVAIMSIAEDFKRGFLAVPGANYSTLLHRSIDFNPFLDISRVSYPDRLDEQLNIALLQQLWDRAEPQGYMPHLVAGDLSSPPVPHKILIHMSTCDSQVSNLATQIMLRSLGIPQVSPPLRSFVGVPEQAGGYDGSGFVEIDWGKCSSRCNVPGGDNPGAACAIDADCPGAGDPPTRTRCDSGTPPLSNTPPPFENDAHGAEGSAPPTAPGAQQSDAFLRSNGTIEQFCNGPCDPF